MSCEERERLERAYRDAAAEIAESGSGTLDMTSSQWKEATSKTRLACKATLDALNRHRKEHGC